jgi:hypothetical protein
LIYSLQNMHLSHSGTWKIFQWVLKILTLPLWGLTETGDIYVVFRRCTSLFEECWSILVLKNLCIKYVNLSLRLCRYYWCSLLNMCISIWGHAVCCASHKIKMLTLDTCVGWVLGTVPNPCGVSWWFLMFVTMVFKNQIRRFKSKTTVLILFWESQMTT